MTKDKISYAKCVKQTNEWSIGWSPLCHMWASYACTKKCFPIRCSYQNGFCHQITSANHVLTMSNANKCSCEQITCYCHVPTVIDNLSCVCSSLFVRGTVVVITNWCPSIANFRNKQTFIINKTPFVPTDDYEPTILINTIGNPGLRGPQFLLGDRNVRLVLRN